MKKKFKKVVEDNHNWVFFMCLIILLGFNEIFVCIYWVDHNPSVFAFTVSMLNMFGFFILVIFIIECLMERNVYYAEIK